MKISIPFPFQLCSVLVVFGSLLSVSGPQAEGEPDILWKRCGSHIGSLAVSPDGEILATGSGIDVKLWRASDGECIRTLVGHSSSVWSVAFSPDGQMVASAGGDETIKVWRVSDGECVYTLTGHTGTVASVALSPDGVTLASGSEDGTIKIWWLVDGRCTNTLESDWVISLAFSSDGHMLASGGAYGGITLWDVEGGQVIRTISWSEAESVSVALSPDGQTLASGGVDSYEGVYSRLALWDVSDGHRLHTLSGHDGLVTSVAFAPDGQILASGGIDHAVKLWQVSDGTCIRTLTEHTTPVGDLAFTWDGRTLVTAGEAIKLWSTEDWICSLTIPMIGHTGAVTSVAFSPDSRLLATGAGLGDPIARVWRASDGECIQAFTASTTSPESVAFSPDGQMLATGGADRTAKLWRVADGELVRTFTGHTGAVESVAFSPDGRMLASGGGYEDGTVRFWWTSNGREIRECDHYYVESVVFSPDGLTLASASWGGSIKLWRVSDGVCIRTLTGHIGGILSVAFSPDGTLLASAGYDGAVQIWRVDDGQCLHTLETGPDRVYTVAFAADGRTVAAAGGSRSYGAPGPTTIRLWRVEDGALVESYDEQVGPRVWEIGFSPDGRLFAYGRSDTTVVMARAPAFPQAPEAWLDQGWNWFSIPLDPAVTAEASDLLGFDCTNVLYRWNPVLKRHELYPDDFSELSRGRGYLLRLATAERPWYRAYPPDGDFEIPIPEAGWTWIGQPFNHDTSLDGCLIRNNILGQTRRAWEDHGAADAWLNWNLLWWNSSVDSWQVLGLAGADDDTLHPWYGYLVWANARDLTLIVPQ